MGRQAGLGAVLLVPGLLVVGLGFSNGGYFPGPPALAAVLVALLLVGRLTLARHPLQGMSKGYVAGAVLLTLLAGWTLASPIWSDSASRAILEYSRTLLYLLTFLLLGSLAHSAGRVRWVVRGLAAGGFIVCLSALITRLAPDLWPTAAEIASRRLNYPLTYWNALGLLAALATIICVGLSSDGREKPVVRVLGAAALPVLATTLLFTFSRGAMAVGAAGVLATLVVGRSRLTFSTLLAALPAALAVKAAYGAEILTSDDPTGAGAMAEGQDLALIVAASVAAAALLRSLMLLVDRRLLDLRGPRWLRRTAVRLGLAAAAVGALAAVAVAAGAPGALSRQYDRIMATDRVEVGEDRRARLTDPGNAGRVNQWRVALHESRGNRLRGNGAGTYSLMWDRGRGRVYDQDEVYEVEDAHSLYVETLAELGIVGLSLLGAVLLLILVGFARRARGPDRVVHAALFGAGLAWVVHAGIDWDWEMPAVTAWLFAAGGLVLAAPASETEDRAAATGTLARVIASLVILVVAVMPARLFLSERPLRQAARAFAAGDCATAVDRSLDSLSALSSRAEPFALLGFCDVRLGYPDLAIRALENAVARDAGNWEYHYSLALVRGAAGRDPRPAARRALELNPLSSLARTAVRRFATEDPQKWERRALSARLPLND